MCPFFVRRQTDRITLILGCAKACVRDEKLTAFIELGTRNSRFRRIGLTRAAPVKAGNATGHAHCAAISRTLPTKLRHRWSQKTAGRHQNQADGLPREIYLLLVNKIRVTASRLRTNVATPFASSARTVKLGMNNDAKARVKALFLPEHESRVRAALRFGVVDCISRRHSVRGTLERIFCALIA